MFTHECVQRATLKVIRNSVSPLVLSGYQSVCLQQRNVFVNFKTFGSLLCRRACRGLFPPVMLVNVSAYVYFMYCGANFQND